MPNFSCKIQNLLKLTNFLKYDFSVIQKTKKKKHYLKIWSDVAEPGSILFASAERFRHVLKYTLALKVKEKYPGQLEAGTTLFLEPKAASVEFYHKNEKYPYAFKGHLVLATLQHFLYLFFSVTFSFAKIAGADCHLWWLAALSMSPNRTSYFIPIL